jgi:hypothetical protein
MSSVLWFVVVCLCHVSAAMLYCLLLVDLPVTGLFSCEALRNNSRRNPTLT